MGYVLGSLTLEEGIKKVESYHGWDNTEAPWQNSTKVFWKLDNRAVSSTIEYAQDATKTTRSHVYVSAIDKQQYKWPQGTMVISSSSHTFLHPSYVPEIVLPDEVHIRTRKIFVKDGWAIQFTKIWKASTYLEAEKASVSQDPLTTIGIVPGPFSGVSREEEMVGKLWGLFN